MTERAQIAAYAAWKARPKPTPHLDALRATLEASKDTHDAAREWGA